MRRGNRLMRRDGRSGGTDLFGAVKRIIDSTARSGFRPSIFTASYYTVDGVSGKVASWVDQLDASHALTQSTSAAQVSVPAQDALFAGAAVASYAGAQYYDSNRAASAWIAQHDGVGCEQIHVLANTQSTTGLAMVIAGTSRASLATDVGTILFLNTAAGTDTMQYRIKNAVANILDMTGANANLEPNIPVYVRAKYIEGGAPEASTLVKTTLLSGANTSAAPSAAAASFTMRLGADPGAASRFLTGKWRASVFCGRPLTAGELSVITAWIRADTGIV